MYIVLILLPYLFINYYYNTVYGILCVRVSELIMDIAIVDQRENIQQCFIMTQWIIEYTGNIIEYPYVIEYPL